MNFSVFMPIYAGEKVENFKQSIDSIIHQTVKANEILIVEDGKLPKELEMIIEKKK